MSLVEWTLGTDLTITVTVRDPVTKLPVNVSGGTFRAAFRTKIDGDNAFTIDGSENDGPNGLVDFDLSSTDPTHTIALGQNHWDAVAIVGAKEYQIVKISDFIVDQKMADLP